MPTLRSGSAAFLGGVNLDGFGVAETVLTTRVNVNTTDATTALLLPAQNTLACENKTLNPAPPLPV